MDKKLNINDKADLEILRNSKSADSFLISGTIYSARDAAHKRITEAVQAGGEAPLFLKDSIIYYMGPSPARPGNVIGSCGPTSSYRMDPFIELSLQLGVVATIGKGERAPSVAELAKQYKAPYLITIGGAAAYLAGCIVSSRTVLYEDLGAESIKELVIKDFPVINAIDIHGGTIFG